MAAILFHEPIFATIVESGDKLYFFSAGTTSDLTVYTDADLSAAAPQPVLADSDGRFPAIYFDASGNDPKVMLHDANDVEKWTCERYPIVDVDGLVGEVGGIEDAINSLDGRVLGIEEELEGFADSGTAAEAKKLATARKINGVEFDGTEDITITADATSESIRGAISAMLAGGVGSFAMLSQADWTSGIGVDEIVAGSALRFGGIGTSGLNFDGTRAVTYASAAPSGSWRCLGYISGVAGYGATLFVRVS